MSDDSYTIKEMLQEFRDDVKERFDAVDRAQKYTNGNVKEHAMQLAMIKGGLAIVAIIVIPLVVYVWTTEQNHARQLQVLSDNQTWLNE